MTEKVGMTLRELIEELESIAAEIPEGDKIEVVTDSDDGIPYTPVISVGTDGDGVRRLHL